MFLLRDFAILPGWGRTDSQISSTYYSSADKICILQ